MKGIAFKKEMERKKVREERILSSRTFYRFYRLTFCQRPI